jgi:hypothetical protein
VTGSLPDFQLAIPFRHGRQIRRGDRHQPCDRYVNVLDFLHDDPAYAREYLAKGEPIFQAVESRCGNSAARFGPASLSSCSDSRPI